MDDETNWQRQVLVGLVVLVAVGALIGGIVALISIKAADLAGIDDTAPTSTPRDRTPAPTDEPTDEPTDDGTTASGGPTESGPTSDEPTKKPAPDGITFTASPLQVSAGQRINLSGRYAAPDGTVLQVQRREGGAWVDFPVTATLNGGTYATWIQTGRTGTNIFRMFALGRDDASDPVEVDVG